MADADFSATVADTARLSRGDQWLIGKRSLRTTHNRKDIERAHRTQRQDLHIFTRQPCARPFGPGQMHIALQERGSDYVSLFLSVLDSTVQ